MSTIPSVLTAVSPGSVNGTTNGLPPALSAAISGQVMTITPDMARELLRNRPANRPISKTRVRQLIADLRAGRWKLNGAAIILTETLKLLDGQHRLMAVAESGIAIETMVVVGVDQAVMTTIDQGAKKTGPDVLRMMQVEHASELSSALRWTWRYLNNAMRKNTIPLPDHQLPQYLAQHPTLPQSLPYGKATKALIPQGVAMALHYLMAAHDHVLAQTYFVQLGDGQHLEARDPAWQIRQRFFGAKEPLYHKNVVERAALLVLGFNCMRRHLSFDGKLKWKGLSDPSVPFPGIV